MNRWEQRNPQLAIITRPGGGGDLGSDQRHAVGKPGEAITPPAQTRAEVLIERHALAGFATFDRLAAPATGALLSILALPAIALGLGVSTGNNRPFEFFFVLAWYLGPIRGAEQLDFLGRSSSGSALGVIPWLALGFGALGFLARARQLRTGHLA